MRNLAAVSLGLSLLALGCAGGSPEASSTAEVTPTAPPTDEPTAATLTPSAEPSIATPTPTVEPTAAELAAYPDASIARGQEHVMKSCSALVYKRGCDETRTGGITLRITLRADGTVLSSHRVKNDIKTDPDVVEHCVLDALSSFSFDEPKDASPSFTMKLGFGDKC